MRERTGLVLDPYFSGTKLEWLLRDGGVPVSDDLALGTVDSWVIWNLTGGEVHATDPTNASRTMLFDIRALAWDDELCDLLHVPSDALPDGRRVERAGRRDVGPLRRAGRHPDQRHRRRPAGRAVRPGLRRARHGQEHLRHGQLRAAQRRVDVPAADRGDADDGGVDARRRHRRLRARGRDLLTGLGRAVAARRARHDRAAPPRSARWRRPSTTAAACTSCRRSPGSARRGGTRTPGAPIVGITRGTTTAHLARAVVEAMAYQTRDAVEAMVRASGTPLRELRVDGGASVMDLLLQLQADQLGVTVLRPADQETTALGAAYLAGLAEGVWPDLDAVGAQWRSTGPSSRPPTAPPPTPLTPRGCAPSSGRGIGSSPTKDLSG